jgi:hypothetical protein
VSDPALLKPYDPYESYAARMLSMRVTSLLGRTNRAADDASRHRTHRTDRAWVRPSELREAL